MLTLFKNRSYLKLWLSQVVSELGDGMTSLLVLYLASKLSDHPLVYSIILMARLLPSLLFGTFVGPIVDKYSKKSILVLADVYRFLIILCMIFSQSSIVLLVLLTFLLGIGTVFFEPARSASIPRIIREDQIPGAVSLSQSTMMAVSIIAPSIGGVLLFTQHYTLMLLLDSATYIISAGILLFITIPHDTASTDTQQQLSYLQSLKTGMNSISSSLVLKSLFIFLIAAIFLFSLLNTNIFPVLLDEFKVGELHFGTLQTVLGLTAVAGSLCVPAIMRRISARKLMISTFLILGIMCLLLGPVYHLKLEAGLFPLYIWAGIIGFTNTFINIPVNSLLLQSVPADVLGRVSGILMTVMALFNLAGLYLGGAAAGLIGPIEAIGGAGTLFLVFGIFFPITKYYKSLTHSGKEESKQAAV
ncbi:MFS transporter [Peribacillus sp. SCS-26]|uniref:MFS transporter n=1 Tax=Paraperibacillus marinus TaxID=3115295 RepID=UPI00390589D4